MRSGFSIDSKLLQRAFREYGEATGKDGAEILNRTGRNAAFRASQFQSAASSTKINADLSDTKLLAALTSIDLRKRGIKAPKGGFAAAMKAFKGRRRSSSRYLKSAWANAVEAMGGKFRGRRLKHGLHGFAKRARPHKLVAEIAAVIDEPNARKMAGAEKQAGDALKLALDFVSSDMILHARKKMAATAAKYSAR